MTELQNLAKAVIEWGALTLLFVIGMGILLVFIIYVIDKAQTSQTIRRNYPVVGRYLQAGGAGIVQWREKSRHLDEYR